MINQTFYTYFLIILLACLKTGMLFSQNKTPVFKHFSVKDGLSQNGVVDIFKDSKGYMWFGTRDGLNCFDGYNFKIYRHNDENPHSISSNIISVITEDSQGKLWIGTKNGLNSFDRNNQKFTSYKNNPSKNTSISNNEIISILITKNDDLWVGTANGLNLKLKDSTVFEKFHHIINDPNSISGNHIYALYEDKDANIWAGTKSGGLNRLIKNTKSFEKYLHDPSNPKSISSNFISCITQSKDNKLWIGTHDNGISILDSTGVFSNVKYEKSTTNSLSNNRVRELVFDDQDNLWIATYFGLNYYNTKTLKFQTYINNSFNPRSISHNSILSLYLDKNGLLWSGTFFGGLNILNLNSERFAYFQHDPLNKNTLSYNVVSAMVEDKKGNVWVGTEGGGLNYFDFKSQSFSRIKSFNGHSFEFNTIKSLLIDKNNNLWIGTHLYGLIALNFKSGKILRFYNEDNNENSLSDNSVISLIEDNLGKIWIGTESGLNLYDPKTSDIKRVKLNKNNMSIIALLEDSKNNIWVGTRLNGLFSIGNGTIEHFINIPQDKNSLGHNGVYYIFEDSEKRLWVSTYGGGLNLMDKTNGIFKRYRVKDGLINDVVYNIVESNEYLWIATPSGISKFNLQAKQFKNYSPNNGLPIEELNIQSSLKHSSGNLFFGGFNGLISFNPKNTPDNPFAPNIHITDLKLLNKSILPNDESELLKKNISETKEITFSHNQNIFSIEFIALNYFQLGQNQYAYMLEGLDPDWNYVENNRSATYTNLEPGNYTFKVKAANNDGVWNESITSLNITKLPPFWKTIWAYILYLIIATVIFGIIRKYFLIKLHLENNLKLEKLEKQQIAELTQLKLSFFTNISHDFRTPLTLIHGPLQNLIEKTQTKEELKELLLMNKNVNLMLRLINQLMDFRKIQTGKLNLNLTFEPIFPFLKEILYSFQDFAKTHKIEYSFVNRAVTESMYFDKDKLEKILYNLLSNAFKYTPNEGKITVMLSEKQDEQDKANNFLEISIKNTGHGIDEKNLKNIFDRFYQGNDQSKDSKAGSGIGLSLVKKLIELHKGYISVNSKKEKYTEFIVGIPLNDVYSNEEKSNIKRQGEFEKIHKSKTHIKPTNKENFDKKKHTVLVAEDNHDLKGFLRDTLSDNYNIITAEDGEIALALVKANRPNLIVSDIIMPKMSGLDLCKAIKSDVKLNHIPVILLTARTDLSIKLDGYHTGANDYISKPFNTKILLSKINNLLNSIDNIKKYSRKEIFLEDKELNINSADEIFLEKLSDYIRDNITDVDLNVNKTSKALGMSRVQLYRKVKAITNKSAIHFIRDFRLSIAAKLLEKDTYNINEICYKAGFQDVSYFRKSFKKKYGISPKQYAEREQSTIINTSRNEH